MPEVGAAVLWRAVLLSLLPGLFWLVYLRSLSRRRTVTAWLWLWALVLGWASAQLTLWLSEALQVQQLQSFPYAPLLIYFVVGVGLIEELAKAGCAALGLAVPGWVDDPLRSLQLSGGVALGFATTENVLYVLRHGESVLVGRFVFSTLGHVLFASLWGFALGLRERGEDGRPRWLGMSLGAGLLLSAVSHGLYDWFLSTDRMVLAVLTLGVLWLGFRQATVEAYLEQEYERELPYETQQCPRCLVLTRSPAEYCTFCGQGLVTSAASPPEVAQLL